MTQWKYVDPGPNMEPVETIMSEEEILATFFPWWSAQMIKVGKADLISPANCIEDWVVVHWASKVE